MSTTKRDLLRRVPLFADLGSNELQEIEQLADEIDVAAGTELTHEGGTGHEFFVIIDGRARVEHDGRRLATLGAGDFLGEIALIDGKPRTATVVTDEPTRLLVLGHREFNSLLDTRPRVRLRILEALATRIRKTEPEAE